MTHATETQTPSWVQHVDIAPMGKGRWGCCLFDKPEDDLEALDCIIDGYGPTPVASLREALDSAQDYDYMG